MKNNLLTCLFLSLFAFSFTSLAEKTAIDAVIVMDSSGSMKKTDPKSLRISAAKLFINLLNEQDRVSVMSFSDNGYPITYLTSLDNDTNIQQSLKATEKISTKGIYTNLHAAVDRAFKLLADNKSERAPVIILLSDGKMDVGDNNKSAELSSKLVKELTPLLAESGIRLFSIAFTEQSDQDLLTAVSDATGGFCKIAKDDAELHLAFTSIFEENKQPDMLPLTENAFVADDSIHEITIVASKETIDSKIFLQDPEGTRFDAANAPVQMKWFISESFDMITIKKPLSGEWKILFSDNNNKAYIVADMSMKYKFEFIKENNRDKLQARAWLEKDEQAVTEHSILDSIDASIEIISPSDQASKLAMGLNVNQPENAGSFLVNYTPTETGTHFATITLKSQTFERQKTFSFHAEVPVVAEPVTPSPPAPVAEPEPPVKADTAPPIIEEPEQDTSDTLQSILIFVAANIIVIILGLSVFLVMKLRKEKTANNEQSD